MKFQARRAFAGVPEMYVKRMLEDKMVPLPPPTPQGDYDTELALTLVDECLPDMGQYACVEALQQRARGVDRDEDNDIVLQEFADSDLLFDVAGRSEKKAFCKKVLDDSKHAVARQASLTKAIHVIIAKRYPKSGKPIKKRGRET